MTIEIKRSQRTNRSTNRYDYDVYEGGFHVATWTPKAWSARGYVLVDTVGEIVRPLRSDTGLPMVTSSIDVDTQAEFIPSYERNRKAVPTAAQIGEREVKRAADAEARRVAILKSEREEVIRGAALELYKAAKVAIEGGSLDDLINAVSKAEGAKV